MVRLFGLVAAVAMAASVAFAANAELTINGRRAAEEYNKINPAIDITNPAANRLMNSLGGELFPDMMGASINVQREFRRALPSIYSYSQTAHYQNRADAGAASGDALANIAAENYYTYCPTTMCSPGSKWVMWDVPFFTKETHKREDGYLGYEQNVSGFATGISRMIGETSAIGLAVGYDRRKLKGRDEYLMENKGDTFHAALFGGTNIGRFFVDGYAGFSRTWNKTKRRVETAGFAADGFDRYAEGKLHDNVYSAGLKASYVWILGNDMRITPSIGLDVSHVRMSGMTERGYDGTRDTSSVLLSTDKSSYTSVQMPVMVSVNKTFSSCFLAFGGHNSLWTPEVRGGYVPQFGSRHASVDVGFANGGANLPGFTSESTRFNRSYGTVGAGLKIKLRDKYIFGVDYDYSFAKKWNHHSFTAMYGVSF